MGSGLSCDLKRHAFNHIALLYHVSRDPTLTSDHANLDKAIEKYKNFMILRASGLAIITPLDIEWVWHVHRLQPLAYIRDCMGSFGKVIPSQFATVARDATKEWLFQSIRPTTYETISNIHKGDFRISIDLAAAAAIRQKDLTSSWR